MGLGTVLLSRGLIDRDQLEAALEEQRRSGDRLDRVLVRLGHLKREEVLEAVGEQFHMPVVDINDMIVEPKVLEKLPAKLVHRQHCVPIAEEHGVLTVATSDPFEISVLDELRLLAGCSIEDADLRNRPSVYPFELALERIRACVETVRSAGRAFVFTARADGMLTGAYDLEEAIRRLQAFEAAGADCLYAPLPPDLEGQRRLCAAVSKPVNALAAGPLLKTDMSALAATGARRVSLGSTLARKAQATILEAAQPLFEAGSFEGMQGGAAGRKIDALLAQGAGEDAP